MATALAARVTRAFALSVFAVRGIGNRLAAKCRPLLEPGNYRFRLSLTGSVGRSRVAWEESGWIDVGEEATGQRSRSAVELLAAIRGLVSPDEWEHIRAKLPAAPFDALARSAVDEAKQIIAQTQRSERKAGDVKIRID